MSHFVSEWRQWGEAAPGLSDPVRLLAAAHGTARQAALLPAGRAAALDAAAPPWLAALMAAGTAETPPATLAATLANALAASPFATPAMADRHAPDAMDAAWRAFQSLRPLAEPAAALMLRGSDARLDRVPETGLNRYGCGPLPDARLVAFSSSTANPVLPAGLAAAEALRRTLMRAATGGDGGLPAALATATAAVALTAATAAVKDALRNLMALPEGAEPIPAASGTAANLIATHVARAGAAAVRALVVGPEESGSGIPLTAAGRHPAARTPQGVAVTEGDPVPGIGGPGLEAEGIAIRDADGRPLAAGTMIARLEERIAAAHAAGRHVILHVMEGSKTGLASPGVAGVLDLRRRFPDRLAVIVDACQMRCDTATLNRYLKAGCLVTATGSKFLGGPAFSGVLAIPAGLAPANLVPTGLADGLAGYSWQGAWPAGWAAQAAGLPAAADIGGLMRWRAALAESAAFAALPAAAVAEARARFAALTRDALARHAAFMPLSTPENATGNGAGGIVTFAIRRGGGEGWCTMADLRRLYERLRDAGCLTGQPVALKAGPVTAGLRIAASAGHYYRLASGEARVMADELAHVLATLDALRDGTAP